MPEDPILIVEGHTHITNRVYWEKIDPWKPQAFGFDYARAYDAGVRVVIENISPYDSRQRETSADAVQRRSGSPIEPKLQS